MNQGSPIAKGVVTVDENSKGPVAPTFGQKQFHMQGAFRRRRIMRMYSIVQIASKISDDTFLFVVDNDA